jgi:hypothetical protein
MTPRDAAAATLIRYCRHADVVCCFTPFSPPLFSIFFRRLFSFLAITMALRHAATAPPPMPLR